jgi:RNA-directed DNA polymerase
VLSNLEASIRRRLCAYLWWQWQNARKRFKELRRRGVPKFLAAVAAGSPTSFWRMSSHPVVQMALRNHYFDEAGLPRLHTDALAQPNRTALVRTRMPGGVGGAGSRGSPLSRSIPNDSIGLNFALVLQLHFVSFSMAFGGFSLMIASPS